MLDRKKQGVLDNPQKQTISLGCLKRKKISRKHFVCKIGVCQVVTMAEELVPIGVFRLDGKDKRDKMGVELRNCSFYWQS